MEQLIYTSCKVGISVKGSGFQVYSASEGLGQKNKELIERKFCSYREPDNLPSAPSENEIKSMFPIVFRFEKLDENNLCLVQTVYLGRDYMGESGRFGNFLTHVLVGKEEEFDAFYATDLFMTQAFKKCVSDINASSSTPPMALDSLKSDMFAEYKYSYGIEHWIDETKLYSVKTLFFAIFDAVKNSKNIVILDTEENKIRYIHSLLSLFPKSVSKFISFCNYAYDVATCNAILLGASENTAYSEGKILQLGNYYLFDFISNNTSYEMSENAEYDEFFNFLVSIKGTDEAEDFADFIRHFEFKNFSEQVVNAFHAYKVLFKDCTKMPKENVDAALLFLEKGINTYVIYHITNLDPNKFSPYILLRTTEFLSRINDGTNEGIFETALQNFYVCIERLINNKTDEEKVSMIEELSTDDININLNLINYLSVKKCINPKVRILSAQRLLSKISDESVAFEKLKQYVELEPNPINLKTVLVKVIDFVLINIKHLDYMLDILFCNPSIVSMNLRDVLRRVIVGLIKKDNFNSETLSYLISLFKDNLRYSTEKQVFIEAIDSEVDIETLVGMPKEVDALFEMKNVLSKFSGAIYFAYILINFKTLFKCRDKTDSILRFDGITDKNYNYFIHAAVNRHLGELKKPEEMQFFCRIFSASKVLEFYNVLLQAVKGLDEKKRSVLIKGALVGICFYCKSTVDGEHEKALNLVSDFLALCDEKSRKSYEEMLKKDYAIIF